MKKRLSRATCVILCVLMAASFASCKNKEGSSSSAQSGTSSIASSSQNKTSSTSETSSTQASSRSASSAMADVSKTHAGAITIPKAGTITIDGNITNAEWGNAYKDSVGYSFTATGKGFVSKSNSDSKADCKGYAMWSDKGLYVAYEVTDSRKSKGMSLGSALNSTDAVQILVDPTNKRFAASDSRDLYIIDFVSATKADRSGPASWFEHWRYNGMPSSVKIEVSGKDTSTGYVIEAFIPWDTFTKNGEKFTAQKGYKIGYALLLIDALQDGSVSQLYSNYGKKFADLENSSLMYTATLG